MQMFDSRKVSIREIKEWHDRDELDLTPNFQRRNVWVDKARSFLIDTIVRGKPIPKVYVRLRENIETGRLVREVVDGQQRLTTILTFLQDAFPINKAHNEDVGGKRFSQLDKQTQKAILYYEFTFDLLMDAPDPEIYDIFARLNKYPVKINDQEYRNSQFFGEFKSTVYSLAKEFNTFWLQNRLFTDKQVARMGEAEFTAELLIAMIDGIKAKSKAIIDKAFDDYDDAMPNRLVAMKRFRETIDIISALLQDTLVNNETSFRRIPLFYTLFCAVYHMQHGLPGLKAERQTIAQPDIPKIRIALERIDRIFEVNKDNIASLPSRDRKFREATDVHTIHASNREFRAKYVIDLMLHSIQK